MSAMTVAAIFAARAIAGAATVGRISTTATQKGSPVKTVAVVAAALDRQQHSSGLHHYTKKAGV